MSHEDQAYLLCVVLLDKTFYYHRTFATPGATPLLGLCRYVWAHWAWVLAILVINSVSILVLNKVWCFIVLNSVYFLEEATFLLLSMIPSTKAHHNAFVIGLNKETGNITVFGGDRARLLGGEP